MTAADSCDPARCRRIEFPPSAHPASGLRRLFHVLAGLLLFPFYWLAGAAFGVPGMRFRWACLFGGLRLLLAGRFSDAYHCIVSPLDSVRHFEMDFFWTRLAILRPTRMLDVSSPRLLALMSLRSDPCAKVDMLNPDAKDLSRTGAMARGLGVDHRCRFLNVSIDALSDDGRNYPLVTCMSVLEHIVDDLSAVRDMWNRVAEGGRLLVSVPCARVATDEYSNVDEYGLLESDGDGFVFWQRYYDERRLQALFKITGPPSAREIYAERLPGAYDKDVFAKRTDPFYPHWREPLSTARAYVRRDDVSTLPGMGVIAMEFVKQGGRQ